MSKRLLLSLAPIAVVLLFVVAPVSAKVGGLTGKWSGYWIPKGGSRESVAIEFSDNSGKGRFTAPEGMEFTKSELDTDSGSVTLEADSKSGKKYHIEGTIDNTELSGLMTVGDITGEVYVSSSFLKRLDHTEISTYLRESDYGFVFFLTIHIISMSVPCRRELHRVDAPVGRGLQHSIATAPPVVSINVDSLHHDRYIRNSNRPRPCEHAPVESDSRR
jgi:hypothetical protein